MMRRTTLTAAGFAILATPALATPSINVNSYWSAYVWGPSAPVSITCGAGAMPITLGCTDTLSVSRTIADTETGIASSNGTFTITGNGPVTVELDASPFNAGGPSLGVAIDTVANQTASFSSRVTLDAFAWRYLDLTTGCSLPGTVGPQQAPYGYVFSPTQCGLQSPDSSSAFLTLDLTSSPVTVYGALSISYAFDPPADVPEPAGWMLLGAGIIGIGAARRVT